MKEVAKRISNFVYKECLVVHIGGDEFIILSKEIIDHELTDRGTQLIQELATPFEIEDISFNLSASIGISRYPTDGGDNLDDLLRSADIAMHQSKKNIKTQPASSRAT